MSKLPTDLVISSFILYSYFGVSFFVSLIPLIASLILNSIMAEYRKELSKENLRLSDAKSNEINETLSNAKMLKLYGWQDKFQKRI